MDDPRRVVITGLGAVAPNGPDTETFWKATVNGVSGIRRIRSFDVSDYPCKIGGEVIDFHPEELLDRRTFQRTGRTVHLALGSMRLALRDGGQGGLPAGGTHASVIYGIGCPPVDTIAPVIDAIRDGGPRMVEPFRLSAGDSYSVAGAIKRFLQTEESAFVVSSGCTSGLNSIGLAMERIRRGQAKTVVCGSADAPLTPFSYSAFCASGIMSKRNSEPQKASRPFDLGRDGGVLSEGAGTLVLESLESALAKGARIYGEIMGFASVTENTNNKGTSTQDASLEAFVRSMTLAMSDANISLEDVDYVSAHAPSDPEGDRIETQAIKAVLGARAYRVPVSSIKSCIGNPVAAAGVLQTIATVLAMRDGRIPPTINQEYPDPACDLDCVANANRYNHVDIAIINSHGLGGTYSSLVIGRYDRGGRPG